ncbi:MAG TPA: MarR family transcriptional regulator [Caulobacteraceae bacterium]|nr:MarR family transcriptional regulator [Caulobacteraceae bacterium]
MTLAPPRSASTVDPTGEFPLDLTSYAFHLFAVVSRHREVRLEAELKSAGLNLSRHRALGVILALEPCTMSELADFSAVDRTTLTRTVDQLVDGGLVERKTPRQDRRQVVLTLTSEGRRLCKRSLRAVYRVNRELLDGLAEADQRGFARALEAFLGRLVDDPQLLQRLTLRDGSEVRQL